ncbi:unnamed protein product [Lactuca virosa]|uniref:Uncharacterized protein n=1 Tax=Lactuca virosa TaxID=75947 RepID=A0AAU9LKF0_9ASTR|nr:unnamed protein product [Lactuca virosa]
MFDFGVFLRAYSSRDIPDPLASHDQEDSSLSCQKKENVYRVFKIKAMVIEALENPFPPKFQDYLIEGTKSRIIYCSRSLWSGKIHRYLMQSMYIINTSLKHPNLTLSFRTFKILQVADMHYGTE